MEKRGKNAGYVVGIKMRAETTQSDKNCHLTFRLIKMAQCIIFGNFHKCIKLYVNLRYCYFVVAKIFFAPVIFIASSSITKTHKVGRQFFYPVFFTIRYCCYFAGFLVQLFGNIFIAKLKCTSRPASKHVFKSALILEML